MSIEAAHSGYQARNPEVVIQALGSMVSLATAPDTPAKRGRPRKQKMSA